jgi:hypothetical protein
MPILRNWPNSVMVPCVRDLRSRLHFSAQSQAHAVVDCALLFARPLDYLVDDYLPTFFGVDSRRQVTTIFERQVFYLSAVITE